MKGIFLSVNSYGKGWTVNYASIAMQLIAFFALIKLVDYIADFIILHFYKG